MSWWRRHKWQYQGRRKAGDIMAAGYSEELQMPMSIVTTGASTIWKCTKCGMIINEIGGNSDTNTLCVFGCAGKGR